MVVWSNGSDESKKLPVVLIIPIAIFCGVSEYAPQSEEGTLRSAVFGAIQMIIDLMKIEIRKSQ